MFVTFNAKEIFLGAEATRGEHAWSSLVVSYSLDDSQTSWETTGRVNEKKMTKFRYWFCSTIQEQLRPSG